MAFCRPSGYHDLLILLSDNIQSVTSSFIGYHMSQVATPGRPGLAPGKVSPDPRAGPASVALLASGVFVMPLLVLGYAAHHGQRDDAALAAEARRLLDSGNATPAEVIRVGTSQGATPAR